MYNFQNGEVLTIKKPYKWTSFQVVNKIRYLITKLENLKKIKVGHTGTLDPLATGLLILCTGKATKKIQDIQNLKKEYITTIKMGATTPSFDRETEEDKTFSYEHLNIDLIKTKLNNFKGEIKQIPPLYSAVKINGTRAYNYARKGENAELKEKNIKIEKIDILQWDQPLLKLKIICSKGTYVRAFARDLGTSLNTGAYLTALERTAIGSHKLADAISIEQFEDYLINNRTIEQKADT